MQYTTGEEDGNTGAGGGGTGADMLGQDANYAGMYVHPSVGGGREKGDASAW
jgi:hypothetical protein